MSTISSSNQLRSGAMVELVDTRVLGTRFARSEGSSPFRPTKTDYVSGYVISLLDTLVGKGVLVVIGLSPYVGLRNYRHFFSYAQVKNITGITCVFLKYQPLHLCVSHVSKRIKTNVSIHTCNKNKRKCSHYVRHIK